MLSVGHQSPVMNNGAKRKVRIGMVLDQPFPPDARVEREAAALAEAGYEVHLLCAARREDILTNEAYRGFYIHRVSPEKVTIGLPLLNCQSRFLYHGLLKNYFYHYRNIDTAWHTLIHRFIKDYGIHILHVHDLRLVNTALNVTERYGLPLVADLHENYPALMEMMKGRKNLRRGLAQRKRWERIENDVIQRAARVITVADEARDRLIAKDVPPARILVLENTVDIKKFLNASVDPEIIRWFKPYFVLTYVGHLNDTHRGIHTVIDAMAMLKDEMPELRFIAAGGLREPYHKLLTEKIEKADLSERVHFTDWLDESRFVTYIEASDICLCPHVVNDHTNATFPNKVYLYHLFKKPVIVSDATPLRRYVENTRGGLVFPSEDASMLANQIRLLRHRADLRRELGINGHKAVAERYNWQRSASALIQMYDQLAGLPARTESFPRAGI